jgi:hypothetical protein
MVQLPRSPFLPKDWLTSEISIAGRNLVLMPSTMGPFPRKYSLWRKKPTQDLIQSIKLTITASLSNRCRRQSQRSRTELKGCSPENAFDNLKGFKPPSVYWWDKPYFSHP